MTSLSAGVSDFLHRFRFESINTINTYGAALRKFLAFQTAEGIPDQNSSLEDLPPDIVNQFFSWIENQAETKSPSTAILYSKARLRALNY
jgi:hypothetical protein